MANNKTLTVFQRLTKLLGPDGIKDKTIQPQNQRFNLGGKELLKTTSKAEFETAKLQAQQSKYLNNSWTKVENNLFQQTFNFESIRIASYADYEAMEFYPLTAAAMDLYSDEATTIGSNGRMLNVYSNSTRVKGILEDLFFNRLDLHTSLPMWTRNLCKMGDNFVLLHLDESNGITGCRQMPNFEMDRREGDLYNQISTGTINASNDPNGNKTKFVWRGRDVEFNSWQIAHFRFLSDDRSLPYGMSLFNKARRVFHQLLLAEDAMLTYRVTRAPERRVYKIFVGNIDDKDVEAYVNNIANRFKRTQSIDPQTGQVDLKFNQMAQQDDFFIPTRDESLPSPIETLDGAKNLSDIEDIVFLQNNLFTALRIPKPFLGFGEAAGDGKNLSLQDIRFSRTINRIQQCMLQELNKIAIIHLYMLGFEDDLDNFTLTLNNPSTQAEMLKVEHSQLKVTLYRDTQADAGNGFQTMSMTRAKREILGWSDDEIKQDLLEIRMEKAAAAELANSAAVIKHTGLFDTVDRIYGDIDVAMKGGGSSEEGESGEGGGSSGGGGLGGSFGGGGGAEETDLDFGDEEGTEGEENAGGETPEAGTEPVETTEEPKNEVTESIKRAEKLLKEHKEVLTDKLNKRTKKYQNMFYDKLVGSIKNDEKNRPETTKIHNKNLKVNESVNDMINDIDDMLKEGLSDDSLLNG